MATFHPSEYPSCPHEVTTSESLIDAHAWCQDNARPGIYAGYNPSGARYDRDRHQSSHFTFCFSDPNVALEFRLKFG